MKKLLLAACLAPCALFADVWRGLDEANYYSGPRIRSCSWICGA